MITVYAVVEAKVREQSEMLMKQIRDEVKEQTNLEVKRLREDVQSLSAELQQNQIENQSLQMRLTSSPGNDPYNLFQQVVP